MMGQLLAHLWGDYILQSDWMAQNKRKNSWACTLHCFFYCLPFCFLIYMGDGTPLFCWRRLICCAAIFWPHFLIDRFGLARYIVWAKNWIGPMKRKETLGEAATRWREWGMLGPTASKELLDKVDADRRWITCNLLWSVCQKTGYSPERPEWMTVWLLIIADNTLHLTTNYLALRFL